MKNCQFYIILGNSSYIPADDFNVYINVSDNDIIRYKDNRFKDLTEKLMELYNVKYQENIPVNGKIIFKIFDEKYRNIALKIMEITGIVGEVEYNYKENNSVNEVTEFSRGADDKSDSNYNPVRPDTMIFHKGDFDSDYERSNSNSNVKTLKRTPKKNAGLVSLPVLVFIISTLLLIASFVMLFILD